MLHQFPAWLHLESQEFWQKALYIELAGECHDLAPMSRSSQSPNVKKRCADSISSFVVIQRQKQNANRLPMQNVKVYFPCLLTTQVRNLHILSVEGAVTVDQSLRSAISQDESPWGPRSMTLRNSSPHWFFGQDVPLAESPCARPLYPIDLQGIHSWVV